MTNIEIDTQSRNRIVSEMGTNFFVEAGAGSGKTTMLVSRMVAMVESGIDISKICAITFTKAAAGEFYERFQKALIERSNPAFVWVDKGFAGQLPAPTEESRERCAKALQNIDLCFMGTIDSFCSMVLSEHPSEAGIPSDATIMSDMDAQILYKQIYVKICAGEYGPKLKGLADNFRMLYWNSEDVFVAGEKLLMNNRNVLFNYTKANPVDIDKIYATDRAAINEALRCLLAHPELKYDGNEGSRTAWENIEKTSRKLSGKWSYDFPNVLSGLKSLSNIRVLPQALDKYAPLISPCFEAGGKQGKWLEFKGKQDGGLLSVFNNLRYDVSMTFLSEATTIIEQVMRDKGAMTFFDYLYYLRNTLKKDAAADGKLIRYIYDRHSYFLIDEFQDTNPLQAEVFFYLASENPVEQWSSCVPRPGSLFIVGDPKQSIYRFRSADVTSFLKVKKLFEANGGTILYLSRNFRSTKQITGYFNRVFSEMLPEETAIQSKFPEIPLPEKDSTEFQGVFSYRACIGALAGEHPDETDPVQIRNIITKLVGQEKYRISAGGSAPRPIKYSDIMIITYGKPKIGDIMAELDAAEIPTRVEGKVPFEKNAALLQISYVYRAVADTDDKNALFMALKSRFIGSCEEEMMKYCMAGGNLSLKNPGDLNDSADETAKKVAGYIEKLSLLAKKANRLSPAALFSEVMDGYEVYRVAEAENLEVLYYTLELLRNAEKTGIVVSLKDGACYLDKLLSGQAEEERCLSLTDSRDCVHIANLHKVKGLEAPIVILAAATKFNSGVSSRIVHGDNGSEGYIFSVDSKREDGKSFAYFETEKYKDEKADEIKAYNAEHDRMIYVAATRTKNALIICNSIGSSKGNEVALSIWKPLLEKCGGDIFEALKDAKEPMAVSGEKVEVEELYKKAKDDCILNVRNAEKVTYAVKNPSKAKISSKLAEEEADVIVLEQTESNSVIDKDIKPDSLNASDKGTESNSELHKFPTILGTMTHRLMEIIVSTKNQYDVDQAITEIINEYSTVSTKPYEGKLKAALKSVAETMLNGGYAQSNGVAQDIINVFLSADEVYCEVPFCYKDVEGDEVTVWNGVMDVIYSLNGNWHIIDYKTNADGTDLDKKYAAQLEAYKKAFKATTGNEADAFTYHIDV